MALVVRTDTFSDGFHPWHGVGEVQLPNGWDIIWVQDTEGKLVRPEAQPELDNPYSDPASPKLCHRHATFDAALIRTYQVTIGKSIQASAFGRLYSAPDHAGMGQRIGIDPLAVDPPSLDYDHIVWGDWYSQYMDEYDEDLWQRSACTAVSQANKVVIYLQIRADYAKNVVAGWWDDFTLTWNDYEVPQPGDGCLQLIREYAEQIQVATAKIYEIVEQMDATLQRASDALKELQGK